MYQDWYQLEDTESVISGLILECYIRIDTYLSIKRVVWELIPTWGYRELYQDWYLLKHKESCIRIDTNLRILRGLSGLIPTWGYRELYQDWYQLEDTESCIRIDTNLRIQRVLYLDLILYLNIESVVSGLMCTGEYRGLWIDTYHCREYRRYTVSERLK